VMASLRTSLEAGFREKSWLAMVSPPDDRCPKMPVRLRQPSDPEESSESEIPQDSATPILSVQMHCPHSASALFLGYQACVRSHIARAARNQPKKTSASA
jgi:hypothetical protein